MSEIGVLNAQKRWPDIYEAAKSMAADICTNIEDVVDMNFKDHDCLYPNQCLFEMVIKELSERV